MKIVFLRAYDFPYGGAAQNRLLAIAQGVLESGNESEVHQFTPAKLDIIENHKKTQIFNGVPVWNHAAKYSPIKGKKDKVLGISVGLWKTILALRKSHKKSKIDFLFINSEKNLYTVIFWLFGKLIGAKLGRDLNEYPSYFIHEKKINSVILWYKEKTNYRFFDFIFVISNPLKEYYAERVKKSCKILNLPVSVNMDRFVKPTITKTKSQNITYCGDLSQQKDGVFDLIKAFKKITNKYPTHRLKLVGHNKSTKHMNKLHELVCELNIQDRVDFIGYISADKIPRALADSQLLVLARPNSKQALGGFPTKLAEYLSTSIPVVVTMVGEIPLFLKHLESGYLALPDSPNDFSKVMDLALSDTEQSVKVGLNGFQVARKYFSHSNQGEIISQFLINNYL
jgi:glycosyltransferase involved in cell wall biosynthesis